MSVSMPSYDNTPEMRSGVPEEGWHHSTLKTMKYRESKAGNPMLVGTFGIDVGEDKGADVTEYFVMGLESGFGESKLKSFAVNARSPEHREGFKWGQQPTWDAFADQFNTTPALRVQIRLEHDYSIETDRGWKDGVSKEDFEAHDGKKSRKAQIADYDVVTEKPEFLIGQGDSGKAPEGVGPAMNDVPTSAPAGGDGAAGNPKDNLPF